MDNVVGRAIVGHSGGNDHRAAVTVVVGVLVGHISIRAIDGIIDAIERENILYLKKFPKIGDKLARQIVLDLKGKLEFIGVGLSDDELQVENELKEALIALGYKEKEIIPVISKVDTSLPIEGQIKDALKLLLR